MGFVLRSLDRMDPVYLQLREVFGVGGEWNRPRCCRRRGLSAGAEAGPRSAGDAVVKGQLSTAAWGFRRRCGRGPVGAARLRASASNYLTTGQMWRRGGRSARAGGLGAAACQCIKLYSGQIMESGGPVGAARRCGGARLRAPPGAPHRAQRLDRAAIPSQLRGTARDRRSNYLTTGRMCLASPRAGCRGDGQHV